MNSVICRWVFEFSARKTGQIRIKLATKKHVYSNTRTRPHFINPFKITTDTHLLRQLRTLRQERRSLEIVDLKYATSTLSRRGLQLRGVNFHKVTLLKERTGISANVGLESEDGLVGGRAEVHSAVGEAGLKGEAAYAAGIGNSFVVLQHVNISAQVRHEDGDERTSSSLSTGRDASATVHAGVSVTSERMCI